jgi:predicted RNase H-like nuclease (RuvC/YqgF family)
METNNMLRNENDRWLNRVQEQETIVMQLREQVGHDVVGSDYHSESDQSFNQQLKLLQKQRNELVQKLNESEDKVGTLAQNLNEKSILEETFRREKAVLQAKLYEMASFSCNLHSISANSTSNNRFCFINSRSIRSR